MQPSASDLNYIPAGWQVSTTQEGLYFSYNSVCISDMLLAKARKKNGTEEDIGPHSEVVRVSACRVESRALIPSQTNCFEIGKTDSLLGA